MFSWLQYVGNGCLIVSLKRGKATLAETDKKSALSRKMNLHYKTIKIHSSRICHSVNFTSLKYNAFQEMTQSALLR
jgi:hypothetical protein